MAFAMESFRSAFDAGRAVADDDAEHVTLANNVQHLIMGAVGLGVTVILLLLMILISGEFADAIPDSGAFTNASDDTIDHGGTAYTLMAVALLIVPIGAVLGVLFGYLSGWFNFGLGGNGRSR